MLTDLSQDERWIWVILIGFAVGMFFGIFMTRESLKRQPVYGGPFAHLFHFLGASGISAVIPLVIIALLARLTFPRIVATGLLFSFGTYAFLFLHALFESRVKPEDIQPQPVRELD
ncbi:MAG: hypothetical protein ACLFTK_01750 [Anaerolineales bacterium]